MVPSFLPALPVAAPLLLAAGLAATNAIHRRRTADVIGLVTAAGVTALCGALLVAAWRQGLVVSWFGGWTPRHGIAVGIDFAVDPIGAGAATFAALLVLAALAYSWRYFDAVGNLYHTLMLVFLAGMVGVCLTGDLFDLWVFFELMTVAGFALAGYEMEDAGPLQGAINFGVTNSIGGFLVLTGIAFLYGRTGALNLAQLGQALASHPLDGLTVVAFVLVTMGFLVKAAIVPFHFWLPDAHAVAPSPVCVLFSGIMVALGLYAAARVYWTVFAPVMGDRTAVMHLLLAVGALTAVVGSVECVLQQRVKRLLAFSTIGHLGLVLVAFALATPAGLAGAAIYVLGHGAVKGALFLLAGILLHRFGSVDEGHLFGAGRGLWVEGALFAAGGLLLAGLPPFAMALGKEAIEEAGVDSGLVWVPVLCTLVSILTAGSVLRVAGHTFLGAGVRPQPGRDLVARETRGELRRTPPVMLGACAGLLLVSVGIGVAPELPAAIGSAAVRFQDTHAYVAAVLQGVPVGPAPAAPKVVAEGPLPWSVLLSLGSVVGAVAFAALSLKFPRVSVWRLAQRGARRLQSGDVSDYVTWLVAGVAAYGAVLAVALRGM